MASWVYHPIRFKKIVDNLSMLGSKAEHKLFICAGVKPTKHQFQLMAAYGIKVIQLPTKEQSSQWKRILSNRLREEGVITYSLYNTLTQSENDFLPVTVMVADDLEGSNPHEVLSFSMIERIRANPDTGWFD